MHRLRMAGLAGLAALLGTVVPATTTAQASPTPYTGIRPGITLVISSPNIPVYGPYELCTANFVFQTDPGAFTTSQQLYLGAAAHCLDPGDVVRAAVTGPGGVLVTIGEVVLINDAVDFALIAIDPALNEWVSPSMAYWGGPIGTYTPTGANPDPVTWVGRHGTPRAGDLTSYNSAGQINVETVDMSGDSGAGVVDADGRAVGSLVGITGGRDVVVGSVGTHARGPSIDVMLSAAGKPLATCPTRTPWPGPGCPPA